MFGVEEIVVVFVKKYGVFFEKVSIVVLIYDYVKEWLDEEFKMVIVRDGFDLELLNYNNVIWYGFVGVLFVEWELGIIDLEIFYVI